MNTDPSQYPDENPLAQKEGGSKPTVEDVQDYRDGLVNPTYLNLSGSYVYRGTDESALSIGDLGGANQVHLGTSPRYHRK